MLQIPRKPNHLVEHPSGGAVFGVIPAIRRFGFNEGLIYLRSGEHRMGHGKLPVGFGVRHIWEGKEQELKKRGCIAIEHVPQFVASLILLGTQIYHDPAHPRADMKRITLLRTSDGTLVLEPRLGDRHLGFHYSVVTWTPRSDARGIQVGEIERIWQTR